jgi:hypothetical protein
MLGAAFAAEGRRLESRWIENEEENENEGRAHTFARRREAIF